jgi:hypothetical protein
MSDNQSKNKPTHCAVCGSPLARINLKRGFILVCDNWHCRKYKEPQYTEVTEAPEMPFMTKRGKYIFRANARAPSDKNARKRERYQYCRDHNLPSALAGAICGNSLAYIDAQITLHQGEMAGRGLI